MVAFTFKEAYVSRESWSEDIPRCNGHCVLDLSSPTRPASLYCMYQQSASHLTFAKVRQLFDSMRLTNNAMPVGDTYSTFFS